jgi:hypothetical protein
MDFSSNVPITQFENYFLNNVESYNGIQIAGFITLDNASFYAILDHNLSEWLDSGLYSFCKFLLSFSPPKKYY